MVSQELRAPLTSIKGSTSIVLSPSPGLEFDQLFRVTDS